MFYLHSLLRSGVDALSPANPLIFGCGLLTGLPAPSSGRMNISAKSPESGILGDANMGGFFPAQMRKSGLDRVIVVGRAQQPVLLYLTEGGVEIRDAGTYWGMNVPETQEAIEADYGRKVRSAVIGRAGENLVRFACVMNARKNAAGRGGMGAVMGSKNLKAVVASGDRPPEPYDRRGMMARRKELNKYLHGSKIVEVLGRVGTPLLYDNANRIGALRTKNAQLNQWTDAYNASEVEKHVNKMVSCAGCTVHCRHQNKYGGEGPEYSAVGLLGSNLGVDDTAAVIKLSNLCNDLGLDVSSAGGIIGWFLELAEKGLLPDEYQDRELVWGDPELVRGLLEDVAERRGLGDLIAESTGAVDRLPEEAKDYLIAVKGLPQSEVHDVRYIKSFALGIATASRGADHLRNRPTLDILNLPDEAREKVYGAPTDSDPTAYDTKEIAVAVSDELFAITDSMGICKFVCRGFNSPHLLGPEEFAELANLATGADFTAEELRAVARRVLDTERLINMREGMARPDDTLPRRYFDDPMPIGPTRGHHIDRERFQEMLTRYYLRRGWDAEQGNPPEKRVEELEQLTRFARGGKVHGSSWLVGQLMKNDVDSGNREGERR